MPSLILLSNPIPHRVKNLIDRQFGSRTVIAFAGMRQRGDQQIAAWWCECVCGEVQAIAGRSLGEGRSQSCGCRGQSLVERFWNKVDTSSGPDACWPWTASRDDKDYGNFRYKDRLYKAHRFAYEMEHGAVLACFDICHSCDNPPCCNLSHLFIGTELDNMRDCWSKGRGNSPFGIRNGNSQITDEVAIYIRSLRGQKSQRAIARELNISQSIVLRVQLNKTWKHVG